MLNQFVVKVLICTGVILWVVVLSPICPELLYPHAHNVPFDLTPKVCSFPHEILNQLVELPICTGVLLFTVVPSPNSPSPLYPHAHNVPSDLMPQV